MFVNAVYSAGLQPHFQNQVLNKGWCSQEFLEKAKHFVLEYNDLIYEQEPDELLKFYHGKHSLVFSHVDFPGLILKIMATDNAKESLKNIEAARCFVKDHCLTSCFIPEAEKIELDDERTLLVMEKAGGLTDTDVADIASENDYLLFNENPKLKAIWHKYFTEAAELILRLGYWDTGWNNILLDKERGFSFVDFEKTEPTFETKNEGIRRLLSMAPSEFYEGIASIAKTHGVIIDEICELKEQQKNRLERNAHIRKWHKINSVTNNSGLINTQDVNFDLHESKIICKIQEYLNYSYPRENLILKRQLSLQFWDSSEAIATESALERLKEKNIICTWVVRDSMFTKAHEIYF